MPARGQVGKKEVIGRWLDRKEIQKIAVSPSDVLLTP
jgi:hypothetical protein